MTPKLVGSHRFSQKNSQIKSVKKSADFFCLLTSADFFGRWENRLVGHKLYACIQSNSFNINLHAYLP